MLGADAAAMHPPAALPEAMVAAALADPVLLVRGAEPGPVVLLVELEAYAPP